MNETINRDPWDIAFDEGQKIVKNAQREIALRQALGDAKYKALRELQAYISRHLIPVDVAARYNMKIITLQALVNLAKAENQTAEVIMDAFLYGQAKGYRAGLAATKRKSAQEDR